MCLTHAAACSSRADAPWLSASQLALFYLFNPFSVLSCVANTLTSAENAAVMVAVAGGCLRNGPLVGFGLAVGGYLGLHPLLLTVSHRCCGTSCARSARLFVAPVGRSCLCACSLGLYRPWTSATLLAAVSVCFLQRADGSLTRMLPGCLLCRCL
jgi:hypothetical protein